jgi:hypothetical protein
MRIDRTVTCSIVSQISAVVFERSRESINGAQDDRLSVAETWVRLRDVEDRATNSVRPLSGVL